MIISRFPKPDFNTLLRLVLVMFLFPLNFNSEIQAQAKHAEIGQPDKFTAFTDNFDTNINQWITENLWISGKVNFGYYNISSNNYQQATGLSYKSFSLNLSQDFEIEASIKVVSGSGGLVFGMNNKFDHYRIELDSRRKLTFIKDYPSVKKVDRLLSKRLPQITADGYNRITIRKKGSRYYLLINDALINQFSDVMPEGEMIGFNVGLNSEVSIDYLKISYLRTSDGSLYADAITINGGLVSPKPTEGTSIASSPAINWVSPSAETTPLETFSARVKANIRSSTELKSVVAYLNGVSRGECEIKNVPNQNGVFVVEKTLNFGPGENIVYLLAANNEGATKSVPRYFANPSAIPPDIKWEKPVIQNVVVNKGDFVLETCIKSPTELKSARIIVNGNPQFEDNIFQGFSGTSDCNYSWKRPVILKEGDNDIFIVATNVAGSTTSEKRTIRFESTLTERKLALVIGNSEYGSKASLRNPVNDANLMEASLKSLGFDVIKYLDANLDETEEAIRIFSQNLPEYNVALFYFAGHGIQVDGVNYIIPTDAVLNDRSDCKFEAVRVDFIVEEFEKYQDNTNIVILDACRNNPYASWERGGDAGFKAMDFTSGTIISFATSEGATAMDGEGYNGLFTEELVKQMMIPQPIESVFKNTRIEVRKRTEGRQVPQEWTKLNGDFYFKK